MSHSNNLEIASVKIQESRISSLYSEYLRSEIIHPMATGIKKITFKNVIKTKLLSCIDSMYYNYWLNLITWINFVIVKSRLVLGLKNNNETSHIWKSVITIVFNIPEIHKIVLLYPSQKHLLNKYVWYLMHFCKDMLSFSQE